MLSLLFLTTADFGETSDTLVTGGYNRQAMSDTIKHARKEIDKLTGVMSKKDADTFAAKTPITDYGRTGHLQLTDVTYSSGIFVGIVNNDPDVVTSVEYDQKWRIKKGDISDWMYTCGGKIYGGYTIGPLLVTYPKGEADELRAKLAR